MGRQNPDFSGTVAMLAILCGEMLRALTLLALVVLVVLVVLIELAHESVDDDGDEMSHGRSGNKPSFVPRFIDRLFCERSERLETFRSLGHAVIINGRNGGRAL